MTTRFGAAPEQAGRQTPGLSDEVRRQLLARRLVLVHGLLDDAAAAEAAATLMMLDATGDERVQLRLTGVRADVEQGLVLMDVIAVLGVPVDVVAAGTVAGGAVGVLAAGRHRTLAPHARLHLHEPDGAVAGRALEIERALAAASSQRERFFQRIAECTGRPRADIEDGWRASRYLEADDAVALGYADEVEHAGAHRAGDVAGA
jgi:ATP-dependent Clp protease, protease subunit